MEQLTRSEARQIASKIEFINQSNGVSKASIVRILLNFPDPPKFAKLADTDLATTHTISKRIKRSIQLTQVTVKWMRRNNILEKQVFMPDLVLTRRRNKEKNIYKLTPFGKELKIQVHNNLRSIRKPI